MATPAPARVAPHFPVVRKECKEVAAAYFHCFTQASRMRDEQDADTTRGLLQCTAEQAKYDQCMQRVLSAESKR